MSAACSGEGSPAPEGSPPPWSSSLISNMSWFSSSLRSRSAPGASPRRLSICARTDRAESAARSPLPRISWTSVRMSPLGPAPLGPAESPPTPAADSATALIPKRKCPKKELLEPPRAAPAIIDPLPVAGGPHEHARPPADAGAARSHSPRGRRTKHAPTVSVTLVLSSKKCRLYRQDAAPLGRHIPTAKKAPKDPKPAS